MSPHVASPYIISTAIASEQSVSTLDLRETRPVQDELELREIADNFLRSQGTRSKEALPKVVSDRKKEVQDFQKSLGIVISFLSSDPQFTQALLDSNAELLYSFNEGQQSLVGITLRSDDSSSVLIIRTNGMVNFRSPERSFAAKVDTLSTEQFFSIQNSGLAARLSAKAALVEILLSSVQDRRNKDLLQQTQLSAELLILSEYIVASTPLYDEGMSIPINGPDGSIAYVARRSGRTGQGSETTLQLENLVIQKRLDGTIEFFRATGDTFTKAASLTPEEMRILKNFHTHQAPLIRLLQQGEAPSSI